MRSILLQTLFCKERTTNFKTQIMHSFFLLWNLNLILESLPISSSTHLKMLIKYFKQQPKIDAHTEYLMHIPNALIMSILFLEQAAALTSPLSFFIGVCIANIITGLTYLLTKKRAFISAPIGLLISGFTLLSLYWVPHTTECSISFKHAVIIGCAQTIALLPGISRLAATCTTALWLGINPLTSFLFSIACQVGLIIIATAAALFKNARLYISFKQVGILLLSSFISYGALIISMKSFMTGTAVYFGWYLLLLGLIIQCKQKKETT